jgi:hypothetical protein
MMPGQPSRTREAPTPSDADTRAAVEDALGHVTGAHARSLATMAFRQARESGATEARALFLALYAAQQSALTSWEADQERARRNGAVLTLREMLDGTFPWDDGDSA